jgi:hypothetical protein
VRWAYVGSRVEQQTESARDKARGKFDGQSRKEADTFGGQVLAMGGRATPSWRQGL